jgi:hypothetical protein
MDLMELLLKAMEEDNRVNVINLDNCLMGFSMNRTTYNTHPLFKLPVAKYCAVAIVATAATLAKHLTILSAIL